VRWAADMSVPGAAVHPTVHRNGADSGCFCRRQCGNAAADRRVRRGENEKTEGLARGGVAFALCDRLADRAGGRGHKCSRKTKRLSTADLSKTPHFN